MNYLFRVEVSSIGSSLILGDVIVSIPPEKELRLVDSQGAVTLRVDRLVPDTNLANQVAVHQIVRDGKKNDPGDMKYDGTIFASVHILNAADAHAFFGRNGWERRPLAPKPRSVKSAPK